MKQKNNLLQNLISFIGITTGAMLAAFSIQTFLSPNIIIVNKRKQVKKLNYFKEKSHSKNYDINIILL